MKLKLSCVYKDNIVWLVTYDTGYNGEREFTDKTFTTKKYAQEYIDLRKSYYLNPRVVGLRLPK